MSRKQRNRARSQRIKAIKKKVGQLYRCFDCRLDWPLSLLDGRPISRTSGVHVGVCPICGRVPIGKDRTFFIGDEAQYRELMAEEFPVGTDEQAGAVWAILYKEGPGDCDEITLTPADKITEGPDHKVVHTFHARNANEACTKRNELLGWEPYKPMEEVPPNDNATSS